jgi:hypothetical protein
MISIAVDEGILTEEEILSVVDLCGSSDDCIAIDVLSLVYQRRKDHQKLREMQSVYRHRDDD